MSNHTFPVAQAPALPDLPAPDRAYADHSYPAYSKHKMLEYGKACALAAQPPAAPVETELEDALAELEDGHAALDRAGAPRTEEGVPLAICERVNQLPRFSADTADATPEELISWADELQGLFDSGDIPENETRKANAVLALLRGGHIRALPQAVQVTDDPTDYLELRASLADNITLFSHHRAALLRLVDAKIALTLPRPDRS